jgi:hypothetical protein
MLAALMQTGERVVYIPGCYTLVEDPVATMRNALAFIDDAARRDAALATQSIAELDDFCKRLLQGDLRVTFVADQTNAFDPHPDVKEVQKDLEKKGIAKNLLAVCSSRHLLVRGTSANNQTAKHFRHRQ